MIKNKIISLCNLISLLFFGQAACPVTNDKISVIFDMNGVLVHNKYMSGILGIKQCILFALTNNPLKLKSYLKKKLYELFDDIQPRNTDEVNTQDEQGNIIPQIMCNWLKGACKPHELIHKVNTELMLRPQTRETALLRDIAYSLFTPEKFAHTQQLTPDAVEFVTFLKNEGYKVYIISNFCSPAFNVIKKEHKDFFDLFDGIVISGEIGIIKPDQRIYNYLLSTYAINPYHAYFIDDQPVNVQAAQQVGIQSCICPPKKGWYNRGYPNISTVKRQFFKWRTSLINF